MRMSMLLALSLLLPGVILAGSVSAQKKKPEPKKPPVSRPTKGTTELAGDNGKFNTAYSIGKSGAVNITMTGAEFTVSRVSIGEVTFAPKANEKILLLKYTLQNPNPTETQYDWSTLRFTGVSQDNVNREYVGAVGKQLTNEAVSIGLKPAQKIDLFTVVVVPAKGTVPKLIVEHTNGGPILRYDLNGLIKGLIAPFADPADKTGVTALTQVPAIPNTYLPLGNFDAKFVSGAFESGPLGDATADEGKRFFIATVTFKNLAPITLGYDSSVVVGKLETADGEIVDLSGMLKTKLNEAAIGELATKAEYTVRYYFTLPVAAKVKTFRLTEGESHTLAVDVSAIK